jgi:NADH-quinone oxidoreductase subunit M
VILTAGYILWTVQRVFLGGSEAWKGLPDMNVREVVIAVPLVVLTIALGILPQTLVLSWLSPSVDETVQRVVTARELNVQPPPLRPAALAPPRGRPDAPSSGAHVALPAPKAALAGANEGAERTARLVTVH